MGHGHDSGSTINLDLSVWTAALVAVAVSSMGVAFQLGGDLARPTAAPARTSTHELERAPRRLTILHTNDLHGQVLPKGERGGLVALGRRIREQRDRARVAGDAVLLLDAGDLFKGTPEGDLSDGQVVIEWMNHLGYDAVAVGNHDFDHGLEVTAKLAEAADFPLLAANLREVQGGQRPAWLGEHTPQDRLRGAAVVRTLFDGFGRELRVGIVGTTPSDLADLTLAGLTAGLRAEDEVTALEPVLDALPRDLDLVVLVSHSGLEHDSKVAEHFGRRVDVIVGGHNHEAFPQGKRVNGVLIAQTGAKTEHLGRIRLELPSAGGEPEVRAELLTPGDDLEALLAPHLAEVEREFAEVVGTLAAPLERRPGFASSGLGNLEADLFRRVAGADVGLQNKPGIRADLAAGEVTRREVYEVAPFGNTVVVMTLTGAQLRALLEQCLEDERAACDVSGLRLTVAPGAPSGARLREVEVGGKPLEAERSYRVATNSFLAAGGDGKQVFTQGTERREHPQTRRELLEAFLREQSPYTPPPVEARIVTVD